MWGKQPYLVLNKTLLPVWQIWTPLRGLKVGGRIYLAIAKRYFIRIWTGRDGMRRLRVCWRM